MSDHLYDVMRDVSLLRGCGGLTQARSPRPTTYKPSTHPVC